MPKTSHAGSTYYGQEGHVVDAEGKVSELDPSRNADGSVVDGFDSEERDLSDDDREGVVPDSRDTRVQEDPSSDTQEQDDASSKTEDSKGAPATRAKRTR